MEKHSNNTIERGGRDKNTKTTQKNVEHEQLSIMEKVYFQMGKASLGSPFGRFVSSVQDAEAIPCQNYSGGASFLSKLQKSQIWFEQIQTPELGQFYGIDLLCQFLCFLIQPAGGR
jgi:hypothetical protein